MTNARSSGRAEKTAASGAISLSVVFACFGVVGLTGVSATIGANSGIVDRPAVFVTLRTVACLGMVAVALVALVHGSGRSAVLLTAIALGLALSGLTGARVPGLFVVGRIAIAVSIWLIMYFCLADPDGRIDDRAARLLLGLAAVGFTGLLTANLLLTGVSPIAGPFVRCAHERCPPNPLSVLNLSGAGRALSSALGLWTAMTVAGTAVLAGRRMGTVTRLQRRRVAPQLTWAVLASAGYAAFITVRAIDERARLLTPAAVIVAAIIAALPLAIALGMARGRMLAMGGLERMIAGLGEHPSQVELQQAVSKAFVDPTLKLLVWRRSSGSYVDADGREVAALATAPGTRITRFSRNGGNLAAVAHDPALADEADVLEAAGSALMLALENARLSAELRSSKEELEASSRRLAAAADQERRRVEQALHDGAQQGLIALRIKLGLLEELAIDEPGSAAAFFADAGSQLDEAIDEIRSLAQGIYPSALRDLGLAQALAAVARRLPITVALHTDVQRRFAPEVEAAVYFCCVEALQNVAKHCGAGARVHVAISDLPEGLEFVVADEGPGFDQALVASGHGVTGMSDRLAAVGGRVTVTSTRARGTRVAGRVPAAALRE